MKGSRMSLPTQMAIGMVLGIAAGALTPAMGLDPSWYKPVGQLFINLVRMVVVPLVLTTLVAGAASVGDVSKQGCRPAHARRRVPEHRPDQPH